MKRAIIIAMSLAAVASPAFASEITDRGYRSCEAALNDEFSDAGLAVKRQYYIEKSAEQKTYFINGSLWEDKARTPVRLTCTTSYNGRSVLDITSDHGSHVLGENGIAAR